MVKVRHNIMVSVENLKLVQKPNGRKLNNLLSFMIKHNLTFDDVLNLLNNDSKYVDIISEFKQIGFKLGVLEK